MKLATVDLKRPVYAMAGLFLMLAAVSTFGYAANVVNEVKPTQTVIIFTLLGLSVFCFVTRIVQVREEKKKAIVSPS